MGDTNFEQALRIGCRQYWRALRTTISPGDVTFWCLLAVSGLALFIADDAITQAARVPPESLAGQGVRVMQWFGKSWVLIWVALVPAAVFGRPRLTIRTLLGLLAILLVVHALKMSVDRLRPHATGDDSFPSGHAASAFFIAALWSIYWPRRRVAFYTFAVLMALARVCLWRHYPSDVVFGALLGQVIGHFAAVNFREPFLLKPERLNYPAQLVLAGSVLWTMLFTDSGFGRYARIFGPAFLLLLLWGYLRQRFDVERWLKRNIDHICETS